MAFAYMVSLVPVAVAARELGVHPDTLRRREKERRIEPAERTPGGRRRYDFAKLKQLGPHKVPLTPRRLPMRRSPPVDKRRPRPSSSTAGRLLRSERVDLRGHHRSQVRAQLSQAAHLSHPLGQRGPTLTHPKRSPASLRRRTHVLPL